MKKRHREKEEQKQEMEENKAAEYIGGDESGHPENSDSEPEIAGKKKPVKAIVILVVIAILLVAGSSFVYTWMNNRTIDVVASIRDITFVDKQKSGDDYYVTFQAADYNLLPEGLNENGIMVKASADIYNAIVLDVGYGSANIVFQVPASVARKAGFQEEQANVQVLWTEDILGKYARIQSVVWSVNYER